MNDQPINNVLSLSEEDRDLIRQIIKWIKFFPLMYLVLWIGMCASLFTLMGVFFR